MSLPRFHLPSETWTAQLVHVEGEEARHCAQVMRRGVGDEVVLFDGKGRHARAVIKSAESRHLALELITDERDPPPRVSISLVQAVPKGSNMDLIIEKAVELGINHIQPVVSERTIVRLDSKEGRKKQEKWQRLALEACKQCGQNWLPVVGVPMLFREAVQSTSPDALKFIAALQPGAQPLKKLLQSLEMDCAAAAQATIAIGPEGDFSPTEYALAAKCGFHPLSLGRIILRVETAALYAMSIVNHELREQD